MQAAAPLAIASSVIGGITKIAGGFSESAKLKSEAKAAEMDARMAGIRATQIAGTRQEDINDVLSQINVLRNARGVGLDSATGRAIAKDRRARGLEVKNADVLGELQTRDALKARSRNLKAGARVAPIIGFADAFQDFAKAGADYKSMKG